MTTIGIIGAGHIGSALAQASLDAGYDVVLANSRGPETLTGLVGELAGRPSARELVAGFIDELGFDVVDLGPLAEGWRIQPDTPGYGPDLDAAGLRTAVGEARRHREQD